MKVLLDSHALVWAVTDSPSLSARARRLLTDLDVHPLVSAASAWEISTKVHVGRWPEAAGLESIFQEGLLRAGFSLIPITAEDALRAARLVGKHRDPFDRMLAAQAIALDIPLLSTDAALDVFGVQRIW